MTNNDHQKNIATPQPANRIDRLSWLWLGIGFLLLPFTAVQTVIPLAAWLAPVFLLHFVRTSRRALAALPLVFFAYAIGFLIATRGSASTDPGVIVYGLIVGPVFRGILYALPYLADRLVNVRLRPWTRVLVFPCAFTTLDWLMSLSAAINSTGSPAYSQYSNLALIQVLSVTGMWGVTFLLMWFASTVNELWEHDFDWRPIKGLSGAFVFTLAAVLLFGSVRLAFFPPSSPSVQVATITLEDAVSQQSSSNIDWLRFNRSTDAERAAARPQFEATVNELLSRTETALRGGAKIVAWQEGSGTVLQEDKQSILDRAAALAKEYDAYLEVSLGVLTRTTQQRFILNESILVSNTGTILWTYDKSYPVIPTESYVMIVGNGKLPFADTSYGYLSTAICNDLHFPPLIRQAGKNNVDILIAPYNDFRPWETEDAVTAIYRAIENGFSVIRPAGHGFSTIVDYEGRTLASQNYYTSNAGILIDTVPTQGVTTIYGRIGDWFAYLSSAGLVFLMAWAFLIHKDRPG